MTHFGVFNISLLDCLLGRKVPIFQMLNLFSEDLWSFVFSAEMLNSMDLFLLFLATVAPS